jgi:hypothetical protein
VAGAGDTVPRPQGSRYYQKGPALVERKKDNIIHSGLRADETTMLRVVELEDSFLQENSAVDIRRVEQPQP